jgi:hypothetical protein
MFDQSSNGGVARSGKRIGDLGVIDQNINRFPEEYC